MCYGKYVKRDVGMSQSKKTYKVQLHTVKRDASMSHTKVTYKVRLHIGISHSKMTNKVRLRTVKRDNGMSHSKMTYKVRLHTNKETLVCFTQKWHKKSDFAKSKGTLACLTQKWHTKSHFKSSVYMYTHLYIRLFPHATIIINALCKKMWHIHVYSNHMLRTL